ncbi:cyclin-P4-1-like [Miscanthus floridulus]|uniref:cyclin-P4-1-like n=1 Tax=Miscanthus floridulus TaxID=154761 RepID=UPI0034577438
MEPPSPRSSKARAPRVVAVLAGLLERAAERGDAEGEGAAAASAAFRGRALPGIPVRRYVERIYQYAGCSPACFVVAYVYLDRLARGRGADEEAPVSVGIDSYTVHRLLITSVLVAAKFMDDRHYNNAYFARVGGVELSEMNALELHLLFALRFRLNVAPDTFARYCAALECHIVLADPAVPLPLLMPSPVSDDDDDDEAVTKEKQGAAVAAGSVVVAHSHHHRGAVVQIMTTAQ